MNFNEKKLYHQIHPLKLLTDWITGAISLYFLWLHEFVTAFVIMLVPPILVSLFIVKYINLEQLKRSSFGKYVQKSMTTAMEIVRLIGFLIMILGALFHFIWVIFCGLIIILFGWFRGIA